MGILRVGWFEKRWGHRKPDLALERTSAGDRGWDGEDPHPFHVTEDEQEEDPEENCDDASANEYHNLHAAFIFRAWAGRQWVHERGKCTQQEVPLVLRNCVIK